MKKSRARQWMTDSVVAAIIAGLLGVLPSTVWAFFSGDRISEALLVPARLFVERDAWVGTRILTAAVVHGGMSLFWAGVLCALLPRRRPVINALGAGFSIAVLDLLVIVPAFPVAHQPMFLPRHLDHFWPWLANHLVFAVAVGSVVAYRHRCNVSEESNAPTEQAVPGSRPDGTAGRVWARAAIGLSLVVGIIGFVLINAIAGADIEHLFFGMGITVLGPPMKLVMGESVRWEMFAPLSLLIVGLVGMVLSIHKPSRIGWLFCAHACLLAYYIMALSIGRDVFGSISV